jgi:sugar phosphate isomerase/epimerase
VHIATVKNRLAPGVEPCDLAPFFVALAKGGYDGRISIEAKISNPATDLPTARSLMTRLAEAAKNKNSKEPAAGGGR